MPTFNYNLNIPNAPNNPSSDQPLMQINTNSINSIIDVDHFSFGQGNNDGRHRQAQLVAGSLPVGLVSGEGTLYTKVSTGSQLFYSPDASGNEYQLTRTDSTKFTLFGQMTTYGTPPATFTQIGGWTFLAGGTSGGLILNYGFFGKTGATGTSGTIQFPKPFTVAILSIQMTLYRNSGDQSVTIDSTAPGSFSQFSFKTSSAGSDGIYWLAIGV